VEDLRCVSFDHVANCILFYETQRGEFACGLKAKESSLTWTKGMSVDNEKLYVHDATIDPNWL
jgi:hypothetical protein